MIARLSIYAGLTISCFFLFNWTREDGNAFFAGFSRPAIVVVLFFICACLYLAFASVERWIGGTRIEYSILLVAWVIVSTILVTISHGLPSEPSFLTGAPGTSAEQAAEVAARSATVAGNCHLIGVDLIGILPAPYQICSDIFPYQGHDVEVFFTKNPDHGGGSGYAYSAVGFTFDLHGVCSKRLSERWWTYVPASPVNQWYPICPDHYRYVDSG